MTISCARVALLLDDASEHRNKTSGRKGGSPMSCAAEKWWTKNFFVRSPDLVIDTRGPTAKLKAPRGVPLTRTRLQAVRSAPETRDSLPGFSTASAIGLLVIESFMSGEAK